MKKIQSILTRGCVFTVLLTLLICLMSLSVEGTPALPLVQFLILIAIGMLLSLTQEIFSIPRLRTVYRVLIHYAVLTASLLLLFSLTGKASSTPSGFFISAVLITLLYGAVLAAVVGFRFINKKNTHQSALKAKSPSEKTEEAYTPRFK